MKCCGIKVYKVFSKKATKFSNSFQNFISLLVRSSIKNKSSEQRRGGPAKNVLTHMRGGGKRSSCKRTYAIIFFSLVLYKIEIK